MKIAEKMPMVILNMAASLLVWATSVTHSLCPVTATACPRQGLQALAPVDGWYELMGQLHCCDAAGGQYVPAEQLLHDGEPAAEENVPAGQGVH